MSQKLKNTYPSISLEVAFKKLQYIKGSGPFERKQIVKMLGYSEKNAVVNNIIGSLLHYGLLHRVETQYYLSKLGTELLATAYDTTEWRTLAARAAVLPELFSKLYARFKFELPVDLVSTLASQYKVPETKARRVASNYQKTLIFSGLAGISNPLTESATEISLVSPSLSITDSVTSSKHLAFPFPMSNGELALLNLPAKITPDDADRLSRFVKTLVVDGGEADSGNRSI